MKLNSNAFHAQPPVGQYGAGCLAGILPERFCKQQHTRTRIQPKDGDRYICCTGGAAHNDRLAGTFNGALRSNTPTAGNIPLQTWLLFERDVLPHDALQTI